MGLGAEARDCSNHQARSQVSKRFIKKANFKTIMFLAGY